MKIEKHFAIIAKQVGRYHAFPTLARQDEVIWLACRSGQVEKRQCHGRQGCVRLFAASTGEADCWRDQGVLFRPSRGGSRNELDAIISAPTPELMFLATRDFEHGQRNNAFLSRWAGLPYPERRPLAEISDRPVICFGHIRQTTAGELLMSGYAGTRDEPQAAPYLLVSTDQGRSWHLRAKVASSEEAGIRLTEFSLGHRGGPPGPR
ncbi:MAG: exo-alpha-sialidase [Desulfobacterales bacterium]|nr:MAG: exo-alpha-sialidase [Desulfobacterales bacterium]